MLLGVGGIELELMDELIEEYSVAGVGGMVGGSHEAQKRSMERPLDPSEGGSHEAQNKSFHMGFHSGGLLRSHWSGSKDEGYWSAQHSS